MLKKEKWAVQSLGAVWKNVPSEKAVRRSLRQFLKGRPWIIEGLHIVTAPVIYAGIVPFMLLDLFVTLYQTVCFPVYGIRRVPRWHFVVVLDRFHLPYLTLREKINCAYCGYANGVIAYAREVASRTEKRWCPIKHGRVARGRHDRYAAFADYGRSEAVETWRRQNK